MGEVKRSWDIISEEKRKDSIREIIDLFKNERDEEIGVIAAEKILDHFLQTVGKDLYNKGVEDSINCLKGRFESLELDMESLLKQ